mgnify:CR=1 FL=1
MKKLKFYLIILLITSLAFNQDQSFDKSIKDAEEQINRLKASINSGNKEVEKLKTQSKKTKDIIELTRKNINNSNALIINHEESLFRNEILLKNRK